ncbi:MAG: sigma-70 family RNA polymerase sigma factor [Thermoanaerobaculia bacterium]
MTGTLALSSLTPAWPIPAFGRPRAATLAAEPSPSREALAEASVDAALLAEVAAGEASALATLYDQHSSRVLGLLHRMLGDGGEAEEVLQEVFLQVWRDAGHYRPERASVRGWILMLARSRALDRLKSDTARSRREEAVGCEDAARVVLPLGSARLERHEARRQVRGALATLPAEQRQALELAFFEGLTHTEVAARLGAPLGTVKSRILLGMRRLKKLLEGELAAA